MNKIKSIKLTMSKKVENFLSDFEDHQAVVENLLSDLESSISELKIEKNELMKRQSNLVYEKKNKLKEIEKWTLRVKELKEDSNEKAKQAVLRILGFEKDIEAIDKEEEQIKGNINNLDETITKLLEKYQKISLKKNELLCQEKEVIAHASKSTHELDEALSRWERSNIKNTSLTISSEIKNEDLLDQELSNKETDIQVNKRLQEILNS